MSKRLLLVVLAMLAASPSFAQSLSLSPSSPTGCRPATGTITLTTAAPAGGRTFALNSSSSVASVPASVTVAAGQTTTTFEVATTAVAAQVSATISATSDATSLSRTLTVRPLAPTGLVLSPNRLGPGSVATGTVTLTCAAGSGGVVVTLSSSTPNLTVPGSVTVAQGQQTANFTATAGAASTTSTAVVTATTSGGTRSTNVTLKPPTVQTLAFNPATPVGNSPTTGTVTLDFPAGAGGLVVALSSANTAVAAPDVDSVTVAAGALTANFTITTRTVVNDVDVTFTATANGVSQTRVLRVRKNRIENFNVSAPVITRCREVTATVKLFAPAGPGGVTVDITNSNTTQVGLSASQVFIAEGDQRATFSISALQPITTNSTADVAVVLTRTPTDIQRETFFFDLLRVSPAACP